MIETTYIFWIIIAIIFGVSLLCSSIGFKNFVYFMSVGYGFAICGIGITLIIFSITSSEDSYFKITTSSWATYFLSAILIMYGLRLSSYLLYREAKSKSYKNVLDKVSKKDEKKMPLFVKITIWVSVAILYVMQTYPVTYRCITSANTKSLTNILVPIIGGVIAIIGLLIESIADIEKSKYKKKNPHTFVSQGLYKYVRCPNYAGEIIFWSGIYISGCNLYKTDFIAWIISTLGYLLLIYVMLNGAKRLESRQNKNYGEDLAYQEYVKKTPILSRVIPIKTLKNSKWIV